MSEAEDLLNRGLLAGYAGQTTPTPDFSGTFPIKVSRLVEHEGLDPQRGIYRDEWLDALLGGGQETAWSMADNSGATRRYAGGVTRDRDILDRFGISEEQITAKLKEFIARAKGDTRGKKPYEEDDGMWHYNYEVIRNIRRKIDLTIALETINYQDELVFAHGFLLSPVVFKSAPVEEI